MATLQPHQVKEANEIIEKIEKALKPKHAIGSQSKSVLQSLLVASKEKAKPVLFKARREYSAAIVTYFVHEKKLKQHKFHRDGQEYIFLL